MLLLMMMMMVITTIVVIIIIIIRVSHLYEHLMSSSVSRTAIERGMLERLTVP